MSDDPTDDETDPETLVSRARDADDPERARTLFERAVDADPDHPGARTGLAVLDWRAGDREAARERVAAVVDEEPADPPAPRRRTWAWVRETRAATLGADPERARAHLERAVELAPDAAGPRRSYAGLLADLGEPVAAREQYERALDAGAEDGRAAHELALLLKNDLDEPEAAREAFARAVAATDGDAAVYSDYGNLLRKTLDEPEAAREQYERAVAADPTAPLPWYNYGALLADEGNPEGARDCLERALDADPDDRDARFLLARLCHGPLDDPERARDLYGGLAGSPAAHANHGALLRTVFDEPDAARERFERALALDPDNETAREGLAALDE